MEENEDGFDKFMPSINNGNNNVANYNLGNSYLVQNNNQVNISMSLNNTNNASSSTNNNNNTGFGANYNGTTCIPRFPFSDQFGPHNNAIGTVNLRYPSQPQASSSGVNKAEDVKNYIDPYFQRMPPGFRFCPTDKDLVYEYLIKKVNNEALPKNRIHEVQLYNYNPKDLTAEYKRYREDAWYFFTSRDRKYLNGNRPNRSAGNGFWKATGRDVYLPRKENAVAFKKSLDYFEGQQCGENTKTKWKMHEYCLSDNVTANGPTASSSKNTRNRDGSMRLNDYVLCKIYEKGMMNGKDDKTATNSTSSANSRNDDDSTSPPANDDLVHLSNDQRVICMGGGSSNRIDGACYYGPYGINQAYPHGSNYINYNISQVVVPVRTFSSSNYAVGETGASSLNHGVFQPSSSSPSAMGTAVTITGMASSSMAPGNVSEGNDSLVEHGNHEGGNDAAVNLMTDDTFNAGDREQIMKYLASFNEKGN